MQILDREIVRKVTTLVDFSGVPKQTLGEISLVIYTERLNMTTKFKVIDVPTAYNVIMGRPWIHIMKGVPSTYHQLVKVPTPWGFDPSAESSLSPGSATKPV